MSEARLRRKTALSLRSRRGVASALIIMILVLLIFFAVLSLVAAAADLRLAQKRADWNQQFYLADGEAVMVYASLNEFCNAQTAANLQPSALASKLEEWTATQVDIREHTLTIEGNVVRLDILSYSPGEPGEPEEQVKQTQGIEMAVLIQCGQADQTTGRLTIIKWAQWQAPFDYDNQNGGVWEG